MKKKHLILGLSIIVFSAGCEAQKSKGSGGVRKVELVAPDGRAIAAFAEGCFWCSEHIFEAVLGVDSAISGYAGGHTNNPTYDLVNTETTGHAETVLVYYNPAVVTYEELSKVFFTSHDATTKDKQGPDEGSSYRSILFYQTPAEKITAEKMVASFNKSGYFRKPIVTEVKKLENFTRAEEYHQNYIEHNPSSSYVRNVSLPRYELFKKNYKGRLKQ